MSLGVVHLGDKINVTFSLDENESVAKKDTAIQRYNSSLQRSTTTEQNNKNLPSITVEQNNKNLPSSPTKKFPMVTRRRSSLKDEMIDGLNIEGLLIVPELEKRLRRNSYNGSSVHDEKETAVDPSDGMLTTSLCTTEL